MLSSEFKGYWAENSDRWRSERVDLSGMYWVHMLHHFRYDGRYSVLKQGCYTGYWYPRESIETWFWPLLAYYWGSFEKVEASWFEIRGQKWKIWQKVIELPDD